MNKIFKYYLIALFFIVLKNISAQNLQVIWEKTYDAGEFESPSKVITTNDTSMLVCGNKISEQNGFSDILLIKTDTSGNVLWQKTYGGDKDDRAVSIYQTNDNSYLIVGYTNSFKNDENDYDIYLLKLTKDGDTLWTKSVGTDSTLEYAYSSILTSDNNILVVGLKTSIMYINTDILLIKMDLNGNVIWEKTYGGEGAEIGEYALETDDKGFLITGETSSYGPAIPFFTNIYLVRTDANGDSLWTRYYGNVWYDYSRSIVKTNDNSYIVSGSYATNGEEVSDFSVLKVQDNGDTAWTRLYGADGNEYCYGSINTEDNGSILIGTTNSAVLGSVGSYDIYLVNINTNGDTIWTQTVGTSEYESAKGMVKTSDGNYIIYGSRKPFAISNASDILLVKVNLNGISGITEYINSSQPDFKLEQNYPNPFNPVTKIRYSIPKSNLVTLKVYDVLGKEVSTLVDQYLLAGEYEVKFDASNLPSGVYIYKLSSGNYIKAKKLILLK